MDGAAFPSNTSAASNWGLSKSTCTGINVEDSRGWARTHPRRHYTFMPVQVLSENAPSPVAEENAQLTDAARSYSPDPLAGPARGTTIRFPLRSCLRGPPPGEGWMRIFIKTHLRILAYSYTETWTTQYPCPSFRIRRRPVLARWRWRVRGRKQHTLSSYTIRIRRRQLVYEERSVLAARPRIFSSSYTTVYENVLPGWVGVYYGQGLDRSNEWVGVWSVFIMGRA